MRLFRKAGMLAALAAVAGAIAPTAAMSAPVAPEPMKIESFTNETIGPEALQAGAHADVEGGVAVAPTPQEVEGANHPFPPSGDLRDSSIDLPVGLVGEMAKLPTCKMAQLHFFDCPVDSQIGVATMTPEPPPGFGYPMAIFNMVPREGHPAEFAFNFLGGVTTIVASLRPDAGASHDEYGIQLNFHESSTQLLETFKIAIRMWAVPGASDHNAERARAKELFDFGGGAESGIGSIPFLRNPTACGAPLTTTASFTSWERPEEVIGVPPAVSTGTINGCGSLRFTPSIRVQPDTMQAGAPAAYTVELEVPQNEYGSNLGTPDLKDAEVTLPEGVSISPSSAQGLGVCTSEEIALLAVEHNGMEESTAPGHCPLTSQIAEFEIVTPTLAKPMHGHVYLAAPECSPCTEGDVAGGKAFDLYVEASGSGAIVKLHGTVSANPTTGRLTAHFDNNPQLPFSLMKMTFHGGPRAPLANPETCGNAQTTASLVPWSAPETPTAAPSSTFQVTGCPASATFTPGFEAGSVSSQAGAFTGMTVKLSRKDIEENLAGVTMYMPPGMEGMLSKVPLCGEPQAAQGTCSPASQIGVVHVAAGSGTQPYWLTGQVYLTTGYKGQPFGLSIAVPAQAGPFKLAGNTGTGLEVVRASIAVDPHTAAITVTSDPLPQVVDGVPLRLQEIAIEVNRPEFMFNPTNCEEMALTGVLGGALPNGTIGAYQAVSSPFGLTGCKGLPFRPKLSALVHAKHTRKNGDSLHVVVQSGPGQANIKEVHVRLPEHLPSRLETLKHACPEAQFNSNPASCTQGVIGRAIAHTPVLPVPLTGPVYFVSHGAAKFPELIAVLQGDGVTIELNGETFVKGNFTSSKFNTVPDVPVSRFDMILPAGPKSAITGVGNLCKKPLIMPTKITGQNGAVITRKTRVMVSGCKGHKGHAARLRHKRHHGHKRSHRHGRHG